MLRKSEEEIFLCFVAVAVAVAAAAAAAAATEIGWLVGWLVGLRTKFFFILFLFFVFLMNSRVCAVVFYLFYYLKNKILKIKH